MLTEKEATILMELLESATMYHFRETVLSMQDKGYEVKEIRAAWTALMELAKYDHGVPDVEEFKSNRKYRV